MTIVLKPAHPFPDGAEPKQLWRNLYFFEVPAHRWLDCPKYSGCLQATANRHWESFSCKVCPIWTSHAAQAPPEEPPTMLRNKRIFWRLAQRGRGRPRSWRTGWLCTERDEMIEITNSPHKQLGAWYSKDEVEFKLSEDQEDGI